MLRAPHMVALVLLLVTPSTASAAAEPAYQVIDGGVPTWKEIIAYSALWMTVATGSLFWAVKWLLDRYKESIAEQFAALGSRFDQLDAELKADKQALHDVERSLMQLKADLPLNYVRKEDAVRHEAVFNAKLDALAAKIDQYAGR